MSDLISREALLEALRLDLLIKGELNYDEVKDLITNAPAIEQGEAVYLVKGSYGWIVTSKENYDCTDDNYKRVAYTTPHQSQSVADALEEAAKIVMNVYVKPTAEEYGTLCDARDSIRALIKRDTYEMDCPEPISNFKEGQWWIDKLDECAKGSTDLDLKRAVATVHHLLKAIAVKEGE